MKKNFLLLFLISYCGLYAQEIVAIDEIYFENEIAYKSENDAVFSGQAQKIRKNEHLVYEEYFEKGFLYKSILYYNRTEKPKPAEIIEFHENSIEKKKVTNFGLSNDWLQYEYFDLNGMKTLKEEYLNEKLVYRCEFSENRKHGIEYCLNDEGKESRTKYKNGKKVKGR